MQTRIGHVHIRYRVPPGSSSAFALSTLENVARQRIAEACDRSLETIFENDATVYVLRKVTSRVAVLSKRETTDTQLAEQWGRNLSRAVVRTIVNSGDDENLVRFENQAEFVSFFLTRLAIGDAWECWYFGAFANYRGLLPEDIVLSVLRDNHEFVPEILGRLKKSNALELVINLLGRSGQQTLWQKVIRGVHVDDQTTDAFRIFAQAAFEIADVLSLWRGARPHEVEVLDSYLRSKPVSPDWTSSLSLADAVTSVLRFMIREDLVSVSSSLDDEQIARLRETLASGFDWLNFTHLIDSVLRLFDATEFITPDRTFTLRPFQVTPTQKRHLEQLLQLLQEHRIQLGTDVADAHGNLVRLLAVLSENSKSSSPSAMTGLLESVVMSASALQQSNTPGDAVRQLLRSELPSLCSPENPGHFKAVLAAGKPATELVAELVKQTIDPNDCDSLWVPTECAGLFLLTRAVQDLRLVTVLKDCGFESIHPLLVGLSMYIFNQSAWANESLDAGAALWSGIEPVAANECLKQLESLDRDQFVAALSEIVAGQCVVDVSRDPVSDAIGQPIGVLEELCRWLLTGWARWLPGLSHSSTNYLLSNFIRRPGTLKVGQRSIVVQLERRPLDEILKLAGYLDETPPVSWLDHRTIKYRLKREK
ncbi:MAG TPA: hypothetical protein VJ751_02095 [Pyrinomonadaceae bacterium]|nr:hypothetical protein [Pyrinomonadaceae bacterium]